MSAATVAAVAGVAVAAGTAVSAVVQKNAAGQAARKQMSALDRQKELINTNLDSETLNTLAQKADEQRAKNRIALQQEIDPELAKTRQLGKEQLLAHAQEDNAGSFEKKLLAENGTQDPRLDALKSELINRAQDALGQGANLPPEFQAELVRAGLSKGAASGFRLSSSTVGGPIAHAIGSEGIALQNLRQQQASSAIDEAQKITDKRVDLLANIFPKVDAYRTNAAAGEFGIADHSLPESGLTGHDVANLQIAKTQALSNLENKTGQVQAQQALNSGNFTSSLIGAGTSAISGIAGAYTGGAGALGSLAGSGKVSISSPNPYTVSPSSP